MGQSSKESKDKWLEKNKHKLPSINKRWKLYNIYGITEEQYNELYESQDGKCAICNKVFESESKAHLDHNHDTKWIRGFLCNNCNLGIGNFGDDIDRLQKAIEYLIDTATPTEFVFTKIPNKPRKQTEKQKLSVSSSAKGNKYRLGIPAWNKGRPWTEEEKAKLRKPKRKRETNAGTE